MSCHGSTYCISQFKNCCGKRSYFKPRNEKNVNVLTHDYWNYCVLADTISPCPKFCIFPWSELGRTHYNGYFLETLHHLPTTFSFQSRQIKLNGRILKLQSLRKRTIFHCLLNARRVSKDSPTKWNEYSKQQKLCRGCPMNLRKCLLSWLDLRTQGLSYWIRPRSTKSSTISDNS